MSALAAGAPDTIASQDDAHGRIRLVLGAVTTALLEEQPALLSFEDHRPQRDRPSGDAWNGLETMCHVSALLATPYAPELHRGGSDRLRDAADSAARAHGLGRRGDQDDRGIRSLTWYDAQGLRLDVILGVRVAVRAISQPFLPGSLNPPASTSPVSPISPLTPPPRLLR